MTNDTVSVADAVNSFHENTYKDRLWYGTDKVDLIKPSHKKNSYEVWCGLTCYHVSGDDLLRIDDGTSPIPATITPEEAEINNMLGDVFNKFSKLPVIHHADITDFAYAIHLAQNIILARVGLRSTRVYRPTKEGEDALYNSTPR